MSNPQLLNATKLSDTEEKLLAMIRSLDLFDKIEISYSKRGELSWRLQRSYKGVYNIPIDTGGD